MDMLYPAGLQARHNVPWHNVREFGATGDGQTDDTAAIQDALDALPEAGGAVIFPPGHYLCETIRARSGVTFLGFSAWSYQASQKSTHNNGSTVLSPLHGDLECLLDWRDCMGTRIVGLTLDGQEKGEGMHGILSCHGGMEQNIAIEDCRIVRFSGSGVRLKKCWVWAVRRSLLGFNALDGLDASSSYDGWVIDNQFCGNGRAGVRGQGLAMVTLTANRIEWCRRAGILLGTHYTDQIQINGCNFDRNFGPAIEIEGGERCTTFAITGNLFRNNGWQRESEPELDCHVRLVRARGLTMTGNSLRGGTNDRGSETVSPSAAIRVQGLEDSVISGNALYHAAMRQLIADGGGHTRTVIEQNPGSLQLAHGMEHP